MIYTMMQVCKEADLTYQALKFYCNEGLIPNVKRDKNNRRIFDEKGFEVDQGSGLLKEVRYEHTGNEIIPGAMPGGAVQHSSKERDAFPKAGSASSIDPGVGGQRRLYRLETEFLR